MDRRSPFFDYQEYQPGRRYGPQYEPGGYASLVQQRIDMTQREDALKFEQGRIKALQEERLHIQKKTFTKWMNSFLQKARMEVDDLFVDLADGRRLLKLLEIISGERLARPNSGRMRVHKIENVNKSLAFLHTKVRLESIGAEDIVDGNPRLILGLIWTIILRFQIQEIEIDVDEENESSEKKSAKDALLLWCQRKTSGYRGVHIHNFTDSWRNGLGFNALIHAHRPDLFRWNDLPKETNIDNLNHAFQVAHDRLSIPKLLDAEDVDTNRPDEKSVMTYVASYYHTFARMKNEQKSGRRIANIIGQLMDCDARKAEYGRLFTNLLEWIQAKILELDDRDFPNSLDGIQKILLSFKEYRTVEKPPKYKERSEIEALYFDINTMQKSLVGETWNPPDGQLPQDLERAWQKLEQSEHARELALRTEMLRQQRLEQLNYKFNTKSVLRKGYLKEMIQVLSDPRYGSNLAQVDATVKKHEAISADILARTERFDDLSAMAAELVREKYHGAEAVTKTEQQVLSRWNELLALLSKHRESLAKLSQLMALVREADTTFATVEEMRAQFQSEEVGPHLMGVERLAQDHALKELQLGALDEGIRKLVRQSSNATSESHPNAVKMLQDKLKQLEDCYDSLIAAAKDRKARLEDARNLYQFLEDHEEEEGWVTDKQRICRTGLSAKDLRGVLAIQQKHTALTNEIKARENVTQRLLKKGQSLIDAKHPKSTDIKRRLDNLNKQWVILKELAATREKNLQDAVAVYQFYADANESESWIRERRALVSSSDIGRDAPAAAARLARHKASRDQIVAYEHEIRALCDQATRLTQAGIQTLQLPTEPEHVEPVEEEEEWVKETRMVPTEVWEEEEVERLEHRTVTEEKSVPQVKALYAFNGQGISMQKGEIMFLINKTNPDWWSVRKADRTDGFVPANYVKEIEPRIVPVQVRRPEKVKTVQRVKKTVLVKQVVPVKRPRTISRRTSRNAAASNAAAAGSTNSVPSETVQQRADNIKSSYDELLQLSEARRLQLEDAITLFEFFAECDDFEKWIKDKDKLLRTDDSNESVETAKRKYEKFVTDLSASWKRLERLEDTAAGLAKAKHPNANDALARAANVRKLWSRLADLKAHKEKSLEGASSVELFGRTCDEAKEWMQEKSEQLTSDASTLGGDLRTVQALQRRHAQLERELEPLREKINTVNMLADSVKSQYPSEQPNVESRQREIVEMWKECEEQANRKRARLENAVGHSIFTDNSSALLHWAQKIREQLGAEVNAKDVATAEALIKEHNDIRDDIKAHKDEFVEVIALGNKLVRNNPSLKDVAERVTLLQEERNTLLKEWEKKETHLRQCLQLQSFNREADHIDASTGAHEAFLEYRQNGRSVDEAEALLKRHDELEARLLAQDDRLRLLCNNADTLIAGNHYAAKHIKSRKDQVVSRREKLKAAASERRRELQAALAYQQFLASADDLDQWIQDKMRTANDQNYRDLTNLERKLQKHEAYEREINANAKQLRNVDSMGQALMAPETGKVKDSVESRLDSLHKAWDTMLGASKDKGCRLRQAAAQRAHKRAAEDAKARLIDLERALQSKETAQDLRSCKRLLAQHQALEQELTQWEMKAAELAAAGQDMVAAGHFDSDQVTKESRAVLNAAKRLQKPAKQRREKLEEGLRFHKYASEVQGELQWIAERIPLAQADSTASDLHSAQHAHKKHNKLREEISGHGAVVEKVLAQGKTLTEQNHPDSKKIEELSNSLSRAYTELNEAAEAKAARLEASLKAQQFMHDALEVDSWLADKAAALSSKELGRDRHHAMQLLTRHKAVELELDTYAAIVAEMGRGARSMASSGHPEGQNLLERQELLAASLERLQRLAAQRQKALVESICRHEYLTESAELGEWIAEQYAAASSEDYGQDYEHLLLLRSKFDELRHKVESGAERFNQCEELAKKLVASDSPYIPDIEKRQEALGDEQDEFIDIYEIEEPLEGPRPPTPTTSLPPMSIQPMLTETFRTLDTLRESWQRLVDQIQARGARLAAAGEIHRFHRDVADALARMADKRAQLAGADVARDFNAALALARHHETIENDLIALDAHTQVLMEDAARLQQLYPGGNVAQIAKQQKLLQEGWESLKAAAAQRKDRLMAQIDLHRFLSQVRDLVQWCIATRAGLSADAGGGARDASSAAALRTQHDALRAEIDARDDSFAAALDLGAALVQSGHSNAQEVEDRCAALLQERARLLGAWQSRQVELDQLIDLHFFLRDAKQLHNLCATQEAALGSEIPATSSVEEVDNQLKKHEAFEKLLTAQDEKLTLLNTHGAKLLEQNHVESKKIDQELKAVNERRKKVHSLSASRKRRLVAALLRAQFNRDAADARAWIHTKIKKLDAQHAQGEVVDLEDKIKKLQKHQAFRAELAANVDRMSEVKVTFNKLAATSTDVTEEKKTLDMLEKEWKTLLAKSDEMARGLEEAQDILEFNNQLDKIEAWIRDKEMMVQAHELGRDYEHCNALLRKLDDLDSDMRVDDKHIKSISALADKLLQQGPSQQSKTVATRRDTFLSKWKALSGALQKYRDNLTAALEIHSFNRDVADTLGRVSEKAAIMSSTETGRDLAAVQVLRRKHDALTAETSAIGDKIAHHKADGKRLQEIYPDRKKEIEERLRELQESWDNLNTLTAKRSKILDEAETVHKFEESLKELQVWVGESVKRMKSEEVPNSVSEAQALLELHHEKKAEIDGRQKTISELEQSAVKKLANLTHTPVEIESKVQKLNGLSKTIDSAWHDRKHHLSQSHQLQMLKEQARQTEDWLAAKEAFLNNDDLGENLAAADMLIRKHNDFEKLLESQLNRVDDLEKTADAMIKDGHYDSPYISQRIQAISTRRDKLRQACKRRGVLLHQSKQLHMFLRNLYHEQEWIGLKMQIASDQNYRELSNLQSKIQKHAAFESELSANKNRVDKVVNEGEELIEAKHFAAKEIAQNVENLETAWRDLQNAAKERRDRLAAAYQARVFLRGLEDFNTWIDEVEGQLLSEDHGKDLASVNALLKRHGRLEQQVAAKHETATQLQETASQFAEEKHFMAEEIVEETQSAVQRYAQLQEPMQIRRDNLVDSLTLQRWLRDAEEEQEWLKEREPQAKGTDLGKTLSQAQLLQKKHLTLEAELIAREPVVTALCTRAQALIKRGHFAGQELEDKSRSLQETLKSLMDLSSVRRLRLQDAVEMHQFNLEAGEAMSWLLERKPLLASPDVGRDEDSVSALQRRLEAQQRELSTFDSTLIKLEKLAKGLQERVSVDCTSVTSKLSSVKSLYEELKLLSAKRQQRLQQSLKYFKFVHECEEVQEWINDQMQVAASEEYGTDVEHVETLQHAFQMFMSTINNNEGRVEAVAEAGAALLDENTPEDELIKQKVSETNSLWEDLKELALARQEALAGARQVHVFDRAADEAVSWIAEKHSALTTDASHGHDLLAIQTLSKKHEALEADLEAVKQLVAQLTEEADRLSQQYPDAAEHVSAKLEEVTESLDALLTAAKIGKDQIQRATLLQEFFNTYHDLMAWTNETLARVTAPDLARDVAGAEQLVARHNDLKVEIDGKDEAFKALFDDGEKLMKERHFLSMEIGDKMNSLRQRKSLLNETWSARHVIYAQHLDALVFKRTADQLEGWINSRVPILRDGKLGESIPHVEELIKKHEDFEKTIEAQSDKFEAIKRITLVEQAFSEQKRTEEEARRASAQRQEAERVDAAKQRERQRITQMRKAEQPEPMQQKVEKIPEDDVAGQMKSSTQMQSYGDKRPDVKRAESMNVGMKTPKRTPSFTTRRRTQSFRRHQIGDPNYLPPVEIQGELERKQEAGVGGKRAPVRSWRSYFTVLCGQLLCFFRDEFDFSHAKASAPPVAILNAKCEPAGDYTKRKHVFRLACADGAEFLFAAKDKETMQDWVNKISFHAALEPHQQLTPYSGESPTAAVRKKLNQNDSSSSSTETTPEPSKRHRSQTEILLEHRRNQQQLQQQSNSSAIDEDHYNANNIESSTLPALPPRNIDDEVILRNSDQATGWGRTRFSNGRDINTEFIKSQQAIALPPTPETTPPRPPNKHGGSSGQVSALVNSFQQRTNRSTWSHDGRQNNNWAGESYTSEVYSSTPPPSNNNSSPPSRPTSAADHRESSGESEISTSGSVSNRDKKKGVFGGLFSRKKRPQSHM